MPVTRRDQSGKLLSPITRGEDGAVFAEGYAAKVGVLRYRNRDGSYTREYVPEETLNDPEYLATVAACTVTNTHPKKDVSPDNFGEVGAGTVGDEVVYDNGFVRVKIAARRKDLIDAIDAGARELSCGYSCDVEPTAGTHPDFGDYDAIQRNRRQNHLAVVPRGRAGPEASLRVDAEEAPMAENLMIVYRFPAAKESELAGLRVAVEAVTGPLDHPLPCHLTILNLGEGHTPAEIEEVKAFLDEEKDDLRLISAYSWGLTAIEGEDATPEIAAAVSDWCGAGELNNKFLRELAHLVKVKQPEHFCAHVGLGYMADNDEKKLADAIAIAMPPYVTEWRFTSCELWQGANVIANFAAGVQRADGAEEEGEEWNEDAYPNEHAARMVEPDKFVKGSERRKEIGKGIGLITGKLKSDPEGSMVLQAYRFPTETWTEKAAEKWLEEKKLKPIKFEPAAKEEPKKDELPEWIAAHPDEDRADGLGIMDVLDAMYERIGKLKAEIKDAAKSHDLTKSEKDAMKLEYDALTAKYAELEKKLTPEAVKADRLDWAADRAPLLPLATKYHIAANGIDNTDLKRAIAAKIDPTVKADAAVDVLDAVIRVGSSQPAPSRWAFSPKTFRADGADTTKPGPDGAIPQPFGSVRKTDAETADLAGIQSGISDYARPTPA